MADTDTPNPEQRSSSRRLWRRLVWAGVVVAVLFAGLVSYKIHKRLSFIDAVNSAGGHLSGLSEPNWVDKIFEKRYALALRGYELVELYPENRLQLLRQYPNRFKSVLIIQEGEFDQDQADAFREIQLEHSESQLLVSGCKITSPSFYDAMTTHKTLVYLGFTGTVIDLDVVARIDTVPNLQFVSMEFCTFESEREISISESRFPQLRRLSFRNSDLDDKSFAIFEKLINQCSQLELGETKITDESILRIRHSSPARHIVLSQTQITNEGLAHLSELKELKYLELYGTQVTKEGVEEFQKKRPDCVIEFQNSF
ncbi:MAG: hypothetical protein HUJ26_23165 [Planctomycetaceae bacterium]|nr:hypothetical protein [Planctomycetaceae bacterium]